MAIIKLKRGLQEGVEKLVLAEGELALALDTGNLYGGTQSGKSLLNPTGGTADTAKQLANAREFSITGDGIAQPVPFDGTGNVSLVFSLANLVGLTAGTYSKVTVNEKGLVTAGHALEITDLPDNIPASKLTGLGTAATKDTGTDIGDVVIIGEDGKISTSILPPLAITDTHEANSEAEMLGLACQKGDVCVRTDLSKTFILAAEPASNIDNWKWLKTPDYVPYTHPTHAPHASGLYKVTIDSQGHVSDAAAVTKEDIVGLGIPGEPYELPVATESVLGGVKVGEGINLSGGMISVTDVDGGTF